MTDITDRDLPYLRELATSYRLLAEALYNMHRLADARDAYGMSSNLCEEVVQREPGVSFWYRDLAVAQFNSGLMMERLGDSEGACEKYCAARDSCQRAIDLETTNQKAEWEQMLRSIEVSAARLGWKKTHS